MAMYIDPVACNGCGDCLDACPNEAIQVISGKAFLDQDKCGDCAACLDACPTHAIQEEAPLVSIARPVAPVAAHPEVVSVPEQKPVRTLSPWLGSILTFVGHEILPRVLNVVEQRLLTPAQSPSAASSSEKKANPVLPRDASRASGKKGRKPRRYRRRYHSNYSNSYIERR
jgi:ferredoxin